METSATTPISRPLPLACSLGRDEQVERGQLLRSIGAAGILDVKKRDAELDFEFRSAPDLHASLERLMVLEGECCPSLEFSLSEEEGVLTLSVRSPEGSTAVLDTIRDMLGTAY